MLQEGDRGARSTQCPHCSEELTVTADVRTTIAKAM
jgi:hypothetical protein